MSAIQAAHWFWRKAGACAIVALCLGAVPARAVTQFRMPVPEVRTLDNGLQVAFFTDSRLPIVQALLLIPAGSAADPVGQEGVAYLTAEMLPRGTSSRSAAAFANELDRLGAMLTANATRDYSTVVNVFLAGDLDAGLEIMSDAVVRPIFDEEELRKVQGQTLATFGQIRRSPSNFAGEQIWGAVFPRHPYARPVFGLPESMSALTPEAVRGFHGRYYRPDRATLAIVGNVTAERAFAAAQEWFGRWEGNSPPGPEVPFTPAARAPGARLEIRLFDAPELSETEIRFGLATPGRGHADEIALALASSVFGGGPSSRLGRLATKGSLGRDARSLLVLQKSAGAFTMGVTIGHDSAGAAVERLRDELRRYRAEPPNLDEISPIRRVSRNLMPVQFEVGGAVIGSWSTSRFYGLEDGGYDQRRQRLESITPEEVAAATRRWLDPEQAVVIAVGPASVLRPQLEKIGNVEMIRLDAPAAANPAQAPTPSTPGSESRGRELVKKALAAHGGASRLRTIKDSVIEADATFILGGRELRGRLMQTRKEPYKMRFSTSIEGIASEQALNGHRAWSLTTSVPGATPQDMDSLAVTGLRSGFESDLPHLLLGAADAPGRVASLGLRLLGDREAEAVEVRRGSSVRVLYFEPRTTRLIAMDQHETQGGGANLAARRIYGDLRLVGGILWPHSEERWIEGERIMTMTVTRIALDGGVDDSIFDRPEPALPPPAR